MKLRSTIATGLAALALAADPAMAAPFHWGPRIGMNVTALGGEHASWTSRRTQLAPSLGLVGQLDFARNLSWRAEASYVQKGAGFLEGVAFPAILPPWSDGAGRWRLDYIDVPVLLRASGRHPAGHRHYVEAGPSVGIALGGRRSGGYGASDGLRDDMKALDWGFAAGLGIEIPLQATRLGVESRYTRGFTNLWRDSNHIPSINESWAFSLVILR